jgi:hypothetical protein
LSFGFCCEITRAGRSARWREVKQRQASETKEAATSVTTNGSSRSTSDPAFIAATFHDVAAEHLDAIHGSQVMDKDIY